MHPVAVLVSGKHLIIDCSVILLFTALSAVLTSYAWITDPTLRSVRYNVLLSEPLFLDSTIRVFTKSYDLQL